jgi:predicted RNA-binding Zn ribbon-like protein
VFQRPDDPVALAVHVINTWDELEDPPELLRDVATLRRFLARRGFSAEAKSAGARELADVRDLRDRLRASFDVADEEAAVGLLNQVLHESRAVPQLERAGDAWRFHFDGPLCDVLAATTAWSLLETIRTDGWDRFGVCAASPCCCAFVDRSHNRSRRYCSHLCADRVAQATYRSRRQARTSPKRGSDS